MVAIIRNHKNDCNGSTIKDSLKTKKNKQHAELDITHAKLDLSHIRLDTTNTKLGFTHMKLDSTYMKLELTQAKLDLIHAKLDLTHVKSYSTHTRWDLTLEIRFKPCKVIHDCWQHVQIEDWPKLSGVWFLLQVSFLNGRAMVSIFVCFFSW